MRRDSASCRRRFFFYVEWEVRAVDGAESSARPAGGGSRICGRVGWGRRISRRRNAAQHARRAHLLIPASSDEESRGMPERDERGKDSQSYRNKSSGASETRFSHAFLWERGLKEGALRHLTALWNPLPSLFLMGRIKILHTASGELEPMACRLPRRHSRLNSRQTARRVGARRHGF